MPEDKIVLLRIQSPDGTKRIEISNTDTISALYDRVRETFQLQGFNFALFRQGGNRDEIYSSRSRTIIGSGLSHGDLIYLSPDGGSMFYDSEMAGPSKPSSVLGNSFPGSKSSSTPSTPSLASPILGRDMNGIKEDEIDLYLWKQDGKIYRKRDEKLCRHGENARCVHCSPLEPWDETYLKSNNINIKHLSFHAYLRKQTAGVDRGKFVTLEPNNFRIRNRCSDHPPWPKGICSKCTPHAVTLNRQMYRHTDSVVFENPQLVDRFLNYWRTTGMQRIGFLYGKYEVHSDVPLGIRATVSVIYEPPQESSQDSVRLLPDEKEPIVEQLSRDLGLVRVGWIFSDLVSENIQLGTVKHFRNINSHFLSAQECIMAGHFQNQYPNPCRFSPNGYFGSKFVTICVTGDADNKIHMEGYQVSSQCMAMVRDDVLVPTKDAPELGYVRESSDKQYVPDVFYKEKDKYGNEVTRLARPLPIEYLLVDVPASTPLTPNYTFTRLDFHINPFPVENRLLDGHIQDLSSLNAYLSQFAPDEFPNAIADFHVLLYISSLEFLPMQDLMGPLVTAIRDRDLAKIMDWKQTEQWATVEQVISESGSSSLNSFGKGGHKNAAWTCSRCTFHNSSNLTQCEICSLVR